MIFFAGYFFLCLYMIKKLNEDIKSIDYFDGAVIPQYKSLIISQDGSLYDVLMVESIMKEFQSVCGYIEKNQFYYYDLNTARYCIDFNKEEVVIFAWNADLNGIVLQHALFNFLSSVCKKVWFITQEGFICFKKTAETYNICNKVNKIFEDKTFFKIFIDSVIINKSGETVFDLIDLMDAFNKKPIIKNKPDWNENYESILKNYFKLEVARGDI